MAKLSRDDVLELARLARLDLSDEEIDGFQGEIGAILEYVAHLQTVDVSDVEPTNQVTQLQDVTRLDKTKAYGPTPADLLKNAPAVEDGHIKVRRTL